MDSGQVKTIAFASLGNSSTSSGSSSINSPETQNTLAGSLGQNNLNLRTNNNTNTIAPSVTVEDGSDVRGIIQAVTNIRTGDCDAESTETTIVAGRAPCIVSPVKIDVVIRDSISKDMLEGAFLTEDGQNDSEIIARGTSSQSGLLSLDLAEGDYSYFALYNEKEYCINTSDTDVSACPLNVTAGRVSKINIQIDEARNSNDVASAE